MPLRPSSRNPLRRAGHLAAFAVGASVLTLAATALGAPPRPNDASATIDGDPGEWVTDGPSTDYFADLHRNGDPAQPANATLHLRYRCATETLYTMVRTTDRAAIDPEALPEHHIVNSGEDSMTLVSGESGDDFTPFDTDADGVDDGWEARAVVAIGSVTHLHVATRATDANGADHLLAPAGRITPVDLHCRDLSDEETSGHEKNKGMKKKEDETKGPKGPIAPLPVPPPVSTPGAPTVPTAPTVPVVGTAPPTTASPASPRTPLQTRRPRIPPAKLVSRKAGPRRVVAGRAARYTLRVTNRGNTVARRVVVRDLLPPGMVLARRPAGATLKGRVVTWRIASIGARTTVVRRLQVRLLRSAAGRKCNRMVTRASNAAVSRSRSCTKVTRLQRTPFIPAVTG